MPDAGEPTLCDALYATARAHADRPALRLAGNVAVLSWADYRERAERIAAALHGLGARRGDAIALLLTNRIEFHLVDAAAMLLGATPFSIYNTSAPDQIRFALEDSGAKLVITEQALALRLASAGGASWPVVSVDGPPGDLDALTLHQLEADAPADVDVRALAAAVQPEDVVTLIYTSGTTGAPKGVELTHANVAAALHGVRAALGLSDEGRLVSYLPMAHIAERICSHYLPMVSGATTTCCPDPAALAAHLADTRPTWFFAVPRVWQKLRAAVHAMALEPAEVRQRLGLDAAEALNVGAAPCPPELLEDLRALGLEVGELWGMSELAGAGTINPPRAARAGSVGPPVAGAEVRLAADGEVLVRGPMVMRGYRNRPEATRDAIDAEGWLHTGDLGRFDDDGYLTIVDRKKELIINEAGKNMSPANIESRIKAASPLIGHAVCIGDARPYNVALLVLEPQAAAALCGRPEASVAELSADPRVRHALDDAIGAANGQLARVEQIKRWHLLEHEWEPGSPVLTPTQKLRRHPISEHYRDEIEALYAPGRA